MAASSLRLLGHFATPVPAGVVSILYRRLLVGASSVWFSTPPPGWRRYKMASPRIEIAKRSRGYLPHWETQNAIYFVTFRLKDSLPRKVVVEIRNQRKLIENAQRASVTVPADRVRLRQLQALLRKAERWLDGGRGSCYMRDPRIAKIVADAISHFDGQRYRLLAWCVMPNHVHVVFSPLGKHKLEKILHSWKSFSSGEANRLLQRSGAFWQREYFDHLVRHEASLAKILRYVEENPARAGLSNWPWVEVCSTKSAI